MISTDRKWGLAKLRKGEGVTIQMRSKTTYHVPGGFWENDGEIQ